MNTKIMMLIFMTLLVLPLRTQAQTILHLTLKSTETTSPLETVVNKKITFQRRYVLESQKDVMVPTNEVVSGVNHFFETSGGDCADEACFGLIPVPAVYFESKSSKIQFLSATSIARTIFMVRIMF